MATSPYSENSNYNESIYQNISSFVKKLESNNKEIKTDLERFDSGAVMLDIFFQNKFFVLVYSPTIGFGVDEVKEEDSFGNNYQFYFQDLERAKEKLQLLMELEALT